MAKAPSAFVTKVNSAGTSLVYSTYLGGNNQTYAYGVAVDAAGSAYVTGVTSASDFQSPPEPSVAAPSPEAREAMSL